jgi:hypothetical protein
MMEGCCIDLLSLKEFFDLIASGFMSTPAPSKKFAFNKCRARTHHPVKLTGRSVAQNAVARDV